MQWDKQHWLQQNLSHPMKSDILENLDKSWEETRFSFTVGLYALQRAFERLRNLWSFSGKTEVGGDTPRDTCLWFVILTVISAVWLHPSALGIWMCVFLSHCSLKFQLLSHGEVSDDKGSSCFQRQWLPSLFLEQDPRWDWPVCPGKTPPALARESHHWSRQTLSSNHFTLSFRVVSESLQILGDFIQHP